MQLSGTFLKKSNRSTFSLFSSWQEKNVVVTGKEVYFGTSENPRADSIAIQSDTGKNIPRVEDLGKNEFKIVCADNEEIVLRAPNKEIHDKWLTELPAIFSPSIIAGPDLSKRSGADTPPSIDPASINPTFAEVVAENLPSTDTMKIQTPIEKKVEPASELPATPLPTPASESSSSSSSNTAAMNPTAATGSESNTLTGFTSLPIKPTPPEAHATDTPVSPPPCTFTTPQPNAAAAATSGHIIRSAKSVGIGSSGKQSLPKVMAKVDTPHPEGEFTNTIAMPDESTEATTMAKEDLPPPTPPKPAMSSLKTAPLIPGSLEYAMSKSGKNSTKNAPLARTASPAPYEKPSNDTTTLGSSINKPMKEESSNSSSSMKQEDTKSKSPASATLLAPAVMNEKSPMKSQEEMKKEEKDWKKSDNNETTKAIETAAASSTVQAVGKALNASGTMEATTHPTFAHIQQPVECRKKFSNETAFKPRYIWVDTTEQRIYWSKENSTDKSKAKFVFIPKDVKGVESNILKSSLAKQEVPPNFHILLNPGVTPANHKLFGLGGAKSIDVLMDDANLRTEFVEFITAALLLPKTADTGNK